MEDLDPESWQVRETFAYFGRAVYMASVLEVGLAHVLMHAQFMKQQREKIIATRGRGFDRKRYEADFDAFMENQFAQTMGNLIRRAQAFAGFEDELKTRILAAKKRRDFLTHHYWRERSTDFYTAEGRSRMMEELNEDAEVFGSLDRDIDAATKPIRESLGIDDQVLNAHAEAKMARIKAGLPWDNENPE